MKNWRGGPRGIRSQDKAGATPVSAGFDQGKARERAFGPKDRPSRQREIAAYPNPPLSDLNSRMHQTHDVARASSAPHGPAPQKPAETALPDFQGHFREVASGEFCKKVWQR